MIIAVDFDGILATNDAFPAIGKPIYPMISFVRELIDAGHEVILWTSRTDDALVSAVEWCSDRGLHFVAVNDNAPSNKEKYKLTYPNGTRKVSADIYIDDHNAEFVYASRMHSSEVVISKLINYVRGVIWENEGK